MTNEQWWQQQLWVWWWRRRWVRSPAAADRQQLYLFDGPFEPEDL